MRGCLDANYQYPYRERINNMTYTIEEKLTNLSYKITLREVIKQGTLGTIQNKIIIQFTEKPYLLNDGTKK